jgi:hypothetical protein
MEYFTFFKKILNLLQREPFQKGKKLFKGELLFLGALKIGSLELHISIKTHFFDQFHIKMNFEDDSFEQVE